MARPNFLLEVEPLGLTHAIKTAETFPGEKNFVMGLGDNLQGIGDKTQITGDIEYCVISENISNMRDKYFNNILLNDYPI